MGAHPREGECSPFLLHSTAKHSFVGVASTPIQDLGISPAYSFHAMTCLGGKPWPILPGDKLHHVVCEMDEQMG